MARWQGDPGILRGSVFPSGPLNLPQGLDIQPSISPPTFRPWGSSTSSEDIVLLAEFSEIEGPLPLLSIPQSPTLQIDLNELVVKVLSTDYLNTSGEFRVYEDTQLVQQDLNPGVHVYVHYFTLYDVRARGFVRPMCLSYISSDYRKLLHYFSQLKQKFTAATEYLKMSNFTWFYKEMEGLILDLEYTKDRYIQSQRSTLESTRQASFNKEEEVGRSGSAPGSPNKENRDYKSSSVVMTVQLSDASPSSINLPNPSQLFSDDGSLLNAIDQGDKLNPNLSSIVNESPKEEGEEAMLRHTTLESVAMQIMECQHILDVISPHVEKKDFEDDLNNLADHIVSNPHSPLYITMKDLNMLEEPEANAQPTICILSLMKRNFHDMRSIQQLCGVGYVGCLFQLRAIYDKFCKPFLTLRFEDFDSELYKNPFGSLFVGNIPVVNILKDDDSKHQAQASSYSGLCWDTHFVKFLRNGTSHVSTPDSEYVAALDNPLDMALVSAAADCLEVFSRTGEREASSSTQSPERNLKSESPHKQDLPETPKDKKKNKGANEISRVEDIKDHIPSQLTSDQMVKERKDTSDNRKMLVTQCSVSSISSWTSNPTLDFAGYEDIQEEEGVEEDVCTLAKGEPVPRVDIDNRRVISKVCRLAGLVQQFCGVSHCLVHSLLSGRPVLIAAEESYKPTVVMYVRALSTLLPRIPSAPLPVLRWHTGTVTEHHLQQYRLLGVCIPERLHVQDLMSNSTLNQVTVLNIESGHISGVAYSGTLVRGVEHYGRKLFHSNSALQVCLQSIIVALGLKVYLLYHLKGVTNRSTGEILKGLGVAKGDWDIIMYLTAMVQKQVKEKLQNS